MSDERVKAPVRSLTDWEWLALNGPYNVADGHARGWLSGNHRELALALPSIYSSVVYSQQDSVEAEFSTAFFRLSGQVSAIKSGLPIFHYSSSVSIDLVGRTLFELSRRRVAVITPTFDNIPVLLQSRGLQLVPIDETVLVDNDFMNSAVDSTVDALFIATPNNPTGLEPDADSFNRLAELCDRRNIMLVVDASFRFFGRLNEWDMYEMLQRRRTLSWIVIEDTGKAWGLAELKVGFVMSDPSTRLILRHVTNELLLNVSPFTLRVLIRLFATEASDNGYLDDLRNTVDINRSLIRRELSTWSSPAVTSLTSSISVEWLRLKSPDADSAYVCERLHKLGVVALPGAPFFWDAPNNGRSFIRVALLRDTRYFARATLILREGLAALFT